ncbi:outer membrane protein transport protein [Sulfitobacter sp. S223]|uniref:OmpP1/FadL family transporter n=1 Tax=Sulfitobacter sp. S223 TaxID=2867023 RepID=UPI0021A5449D|nr:outer membrane protein transport protein [Sulfitobacter sp. S223]UWR27800.1 outer membrane protein transport protein [Sulfitobacter sp. S223]
MRRNLIAIAGLLASTTSAYAVGLDRSGQDINVLFETGNHIQFRFGSINPDIDGADQQVFGGASIGNVADDFRVLGLGFKYELTDKLSFAVIADEPFGSDVVYPGDPASTFLGGTSAIVESYAVTALARYKFTDKWSVHGGLKYQEVSADVTLGGLAYRSANGYQGSFEADGAVGFVLGTAYERPDIALRVALTYHSKVSHDLRTTETINGVPIAPISTTEVHTPESLNLSFQSGVAKDTLVFGSLRYARYGDTEVSPIGFTTNTGNSLTDLEDGFDFELGVGRRFNEKWSGSVAAGFSTKGNDDLVSPLAPTNGSKHISLGVKYDVSDRMAVSGGVRYTFLGDAIAAPAGNAVADFDDNTAVSIGLNIGIKL